MTEFFLWIDYIIGKIKEGGKINSSTLNYIHVIDFSELFLNIEVLQVQITIYHGAVAPPSCLGFTCKCRGMYYTCRVTINNVKYEGKLS